MTHHAPISHTHHETLNSRQVALHTKNFMFYAWGFNICFQQNKYIVYRAGMQRYSSSLCESTYEMFDRHATRSEGGIPVFRFLLSVLLEK